MEEQSSASGRWKARLDIPAKGTVVARGPNAIGGWALHEWRRIQCVLVTVDGRPHTWITEFYERPDVTDRWGEFPTVLGAGWSAELDLTDHTGDQVVISAYALLEPRRGATRRLGQVRHIGTATCAVAGDAGGDDSDDGHGDVVVVRSGSMHRPPSLSPGFVRVSGHVVGSDDVATVRLIQDGRDAGLARTSPAGSVTRFDGVVEVPAEAAVLRLSAEVTLVSGDTFSLTPWRSEVRPAPAPPVDPERLALVRERSRSRLDAQRAAVPPGEPAVLVATHNLALGGGQLWLHELMRRLIERGMRFAVTSPTSGVLTDELESLGVPVLVTGPTQVRDPEAYEAQVHAIGAWAVEHGCRAALANTVTAFTGVDAAVRLGLPVMWAIHESFPFGQFWMEAFGPGETHPYVIERARASLAVTTRAVFEARETLRFYEPLLAPDAGVVVPYGVDLTEIDAFRERVDRDALRAELGLGRDTLVLLCMGTIEPRKGQLNLAQAFGRSKLLRGSGCELVFVGAVEGAPYAEELARLVDELVDQFPGVRIRIEPVQPDIHRWYHASDVLVCASDVESLPRSMLEAMAFGRPVASTAVFGIPDLVEDGVSGFLCRDRDLGALRAMLERVGVTDRAQLRAMGARARDVVHTRHDPAGYERYFLDELSSALDPGERVGGDHV